MCLKKTKIIQQKYFHPSQRLISERGKDKALILSLLIISPLRKELHRDSGDTFPFKRALVLSLTNFKPQQTQQHMEKDIIVSETEEEVDSDDGDTWCTAMMYCLPRSKESSPHKLATTKTRQIQPFKKINKDMQNFLAKHFSFDDHDDKGSIFFSSLPSLQRNHNDTSCEFLNPQDCQLLSFLRPMKKHMRKCRKRYMAFERITKLLQRTGCSTDTELLWATTACQPPHPASSEDADATLTKNVSLKSFPAGEKVDIGMRAYANCTGTVVKQLSESFIIS